MVMVLVPYPTLAQGEFVEGLGPRVGYDFGQEQLVMGVHLVHRITSYARGEPEVTAGLGGEFNTLLISYETQYVFNRDATIPFYAGARVGYQFREAPGANTPAGGLVVGLDRGISGGHLLQLQLQYMRYDQGPSSTRLLTALTFDLF